MITLAMLATLSVPPRQYDHYPSRPFEIVEVLDNRLLDALCPRRERLTVACTMGRKIYVRNDLTAAALRRVVRHEYGHLNGWRH